MFEKKDDCARKFFGRFFYSLIREFTSRSYYFRYSKISKIYQAKKFDNFLKKIIIEKNNMYPQKENQSRISIIIAILSAGFSLEGGKLKICNKL